MREDYRAILPERHRLAGAEIIRGEDLAEEAMILRRHCEALSETSRYFTDRNIRPLFSFITTSDERALALVRAGVEIGQASGWDRVCQYVEISLAARSIKKNT